MSKKRYELTDEHRKEFKPWADYWTKNAMSTDAMTDEDREICIESVYGLYASANLPPPKHIVFVPSPFVLRFAGGFAAAIWHNFKNDATYDATYDATHIDTRAATDASTMASTMAAM